MHAWLPSTATTSSTPPIPMPPWPSGSGAAQLRHNRSLPSLPRIR